MRFHIAMRQTLIEITNSQNNFFGFVLIDTYNLNAQGREEKKFIITS